MNFCIKREFLGEPNKENAKPKIPRPPNAFMLYANENRKKMSQVYPTESNKDISKRLGNSWKSLSEEERHKFFEKAKVIGLQHKKEYPDYVYNPKEARIRKAMRDATRERSIGASPMLQRPNARRPSHGWMPPHEELMMSPLGGMRAAMEAPVCGFPLSSSGNSQFMGAMGGGGYTKMEPAPIAAAAASAVHSSYMQQQSSPLAQLQQHAEMWPDYQHPPMPPRTPANPFMMGEVAPAAAQYQTHAAEMGLMEKHTVRPIPSTPPQPDPPQMNSSSSNAQNDSNLNGVPENPDSIEKLQEVANFDHPNNKSSNLEGVQTQMETHQQQDHFLTVFEQADNSEARHQFEKIEETKIKRARLQPYPEHVLHLPLSSQKFCVSQKLFCNDYKYQNGYIQDYFQNTPSMTLMTVTTPSGFTFPYATYTPNLKNHPQQLQAMERSSF